MNNQFLVSLSQQMAASRSMEVIANNLANMSTPGFKRESMLFEKYVVPVQASDEDGGVNGTVDVSFVADKGVVRDTQEGEIEPTGGTLDFAISGNGYFAVQTPNGEQYTRNGHFTLNDQNQIVTDDGYAVQGDSGPISVTPQDGEVRVAPDGTVTGAQGQIGKLKVMSFSDEHALKKSGAGLFADPSGSGQPSTTAKIAQGAIEKSNVQPVLEMTRMMDVLRSYQASSSLVQANQDLLKETIEKLGQAPQG
jgi:flagellar basal-body rod protein FlgF